MISSIYHLIYFSYFVVTFQKENNFPFDSPATTTDWLLLNYRQLFENYDWIIDSQKYLFSGIDVNIQNCMILVCIYITYIFHIQTLISQMARRVGVEVIKEFFVWIHPFLLHFIQNKEFICITLRSANWQKETKLGCWPCSGK